MFVLMLNGTATFAQKTDTANKTLVDLSADNVIGFKTDSGDISKFVGNAVFHQGTDTLYCDSLYQNKATKIIEAFSNVRIAQEGGTHGTSDYLRYITDKKLAYMHGNVSLTDGKNDLVTEDLTYDLGTKTGNYENGGALHNDSTDVTSHSGTYNVKTKDARFMGNVVITDPEYKIRSEDVEYNTETKVTRFFAPSTVISDSGKSILHTTAGTYDGKKGIAHFTGHSSLWNDGEYIEGDSLDYSKVTGYGVGNGHVVCIDTEHHSRLFCGHAEYFHHKRVLWAYIIPVMEQVNGADTFYMRADTFYSAPMVKKRLPKTQKKTSAIPEVPVRESKKVLGVKKPSAAKDSDKLKEVSPRAKDTTITVGDTMSVHMPEFVWVLPEGPKLRKLDTLKPREPLVEGKRKKRQLSSRVTSYVDTSATDTSAPMYFVAWNHVLLYSDSMQGKCDSVCYTRSDSTVRMIVDPIAWAQKSQITGDTILLHLDSSELKSLYIPNNSTVISQSGPEKAGLFDQVQGKTLTAYFKHNEISNMVVVPDAECVYYSKDDAGAYVGLDQGKSVKMLIYFENQNITNIKFQEDVHQTLTPMEKADIRNAKLSRFRWLIEDRPKSKEELFR